jgi:uncharacterized protein YigE (DUF2233 family)
MAAIKILVASCLITALCSSYNAKAALLSFSKNCFQQEDTIPIKADNKLVELHSINNTQSAIDTSINLLKKYEDSIKVLNQSIIIEKQKNASHNFFKGSIKDSLDLLKEYIYKSFSPNGSRAFKLFYDGKYYSCFEANPKILDIQMHLNDSLKNTAGTINNVTEQLSSLGKLVIFCTNAGMFKSDFTPQGLYIENSKIVQNEDKRKGLYGNFYLEPNGVFYISKDKTPGLISTDDLTDSIKLTMLFATQSGPMAVYNNVINSNFTQNSKNVNIRSGVGILENGNVVFVISEDKVNFYDFASVFKEKLKCASALYLDGAISESYIPALLKLKTTGQFGPMISISK